MNNGRIAIRGQVLTPTAPGRSRRAHGGPGRTDTAADTDGVGTRRRGSQPDRPDDYRNKQQQEPSHGAPSVTPARSGRSLPGRIAAPRLTDDDRKTFEDLWSAARPGIERVVRARGVRGADQDDVVQEVAVRAYTAWSNQAITTSFAGWCAGTARHVSSDLWRRRRDEPLPPEALDIPALGSTEELVEGGLDLVGFSRAWKTLTISEREALLSAAPEGATAAELNRFYVSLHRLRTRTRRLAESFTPAIVGVFERARDMIGLGGVDAASVAFAVAAGLVVGSLVQPPLPTSSRPPPAAAMTVVPRVGRPVPTGSILPTGGPSPRSERTRRDSRLARGLRAPVEKRRDVALPGGTSGFAGVWHDDPYAPLPLACAGLKGLTSAVCVDYPVRP